MNLLKKSICALLTASVVIAGCSGSGNNSDTYIRFQIEDQHYELDHAILSLLSLRRDDWQFLEIGQDIAKVNTITTVPSASIQWRMKLDSLKALEGRVIDLNKVNHPEMASPIALFRVTDDISAYNLVDSPLTVTIVTVSEDFVEGTFEGRRLSYGSVKMGDIKDVAVSGSYRARIER